MGPGPDAGEKIHTGPAGKSSMKIIGGRYKGRRLKTPAKGTLRPTLAKIREAFFDIVGQDIEGGCFLDLYAGTGAMGIEALSRGAGMVYFVDDARTASTLLLKNLALIKDNLLEKDLYSVLRMDASRALERLRESKTTIDIAYVDPPYGGREAYMKVLPELLKSTLMSTVFIVGIEHDKTMMDSMGSIAPGFHLKIYRYGDTCLSVVRR